MRRLLMRFPVLLTILVAFAGCATQPGFDEIANSFLDSVRRDGGLLISCPPGKSHMTLSLEGAGGAGGCVDNFYRDAVPNCEKADQSESQPKQDAICRAIAAFPEQISRLGTTPRVDASGFGTYWEIDFAEPKGESRGRRVLVILRDGPPPTELAIVY